MSSNKRSSTWQEEVAKGFSRFFSRTSQEKDEENERTSPGDEQEKSESSFSRFFSRTTSQDKKEGSERSSSDKTALEAQGQSPSRFFSRGASLDRKEASEKSFIDSENVEEQERSRSLPKFYSRETLQERREESDNVSVRGNKEPEKARSFSRLFSRTASQDKEDGNDRSKSPTGKSSSQEDKNNSLTSDNSDSLSFTEPEQNISTAESQENTGLNHDTKEHNNEKQPKEKILEFFGHLFSFSPKSPPSIPKATGNQELSKEHEEAQIRINLEEEALNQEEISDVSSPASPVTETTATNKEINLNVNDLETSSEIELHQKMDPCSVAKQSATEAAMGRLHCAWNHCKKNVLDKMRVLKKKIADKHCSASGPPVRSPHLRLVHAEVHVRPQKHRSRVGLSSHVAGSVRKEGDLMYKKPDPPCYESPIRTSAASADSGTQAPLQTFPQISRADSLSCMVEPQETENRGLKSQQQRQVDFLDEQQMQTICPSGSTNQYQMKTIQSPHSPHQQTPITTDITKEHHGHQDNVQLHQSLLQTSPTEGGQQIGNAESDEGTIRKAEDSIHFHSEQILDKRSLLTQLNTLHMDMCHLTNSTISTIQNEDKTLTELVQCFRQRNKLLEMQNTLQEQQNANLKQLSTDLENLKGVIKQTVTSLTPNKPERSLQSTSASVSTPGNIIPGMQSPIGNSSGGRAAKRSLFNNESSTPVKKKK